MKKILTLLLFVFALLPVKADDSFFQTLKLLNSQCPISAGISGELTSIAYEKGDVNFTYSLNEQYTNLQSLRDNPTTTKNNAKVTLANSNGVMAQLLKEMDGQHAGATFLYKGKTSGTIVRVHFTPDEVHYMATQENRDPLTALQAQCDATNSQCPMQVAQGMVMERMNIAGSYVVSHIKVDESVFSITVANQNKEAIKQTIKSALNPNDPTMQVMMQLCVQCEKGICYRYISKTDPKQNCCIFITPAEVAQIYAQGKQ